MCGCSTWHSLHAARLDETRLRAGRACMPRLRRPSPYPGSAARRRSNSGHPRTPRPSHDGARTTGARPARRAGSRVDLGRLKRSACHHPRSEGPIQPSADSPCRDPSTARSFRDHTYKIRPALKRPHARHSCLGAAFGPAKHCAETLVYFTYAARTRSVSTSAPGPRSHPISIPAPFGTENIHWAVPASAIGVGNESIQQQLESELQYEPGRQQYLHVNYSWHHVAPERTRLAGPSNRNRS